MSPRIGSPYKACDDERSAYVMAARRRAVVLLVLCAVLWSTGGLLIKWIAWPALAVAGMRSANAALVLLCVLREWRTGYARGWPPSHDYRPRLCAPGQQTYVCGPVGGRPGPSRAPRSLAAGGEGRLRGTSRGHGRETGRRWWVSPREKWLYFSYTLRLQRQSRAVSLWKSKYNG